MFGFISADISRIWIFGNARVNRKATTWVSFVGRVVTFLDPIPVLEKCKEIMSPMFRFKIMSYLLYDWRRLFPLYAVQTPGKNDKDGPSESMVGSNAILRF